MLVCDTPPLYRVQGVAPLNQGPMEKRQEGMRVEALAGPLRQAASLGRTSDPGVPGPPARNHGREDGQLSAR